MVRTNAAAAASALRPAGAAWGALVALAATAREAGEARELPPADAALELARSVVPERRRATGRRRPVVPAGRIVEVLPGPRRGSPLLAPAPGSVAGIDEERQGVAIYRVVAAGRIEGRLLEEGARLLLTRHRTAERGEWIALADRRSIRLCVVGSEGPAVHEGRFLGVVEAVVAEGERRRCA